MNKKGVTIVELLAAIIIMGLVIGLVSMLLSSLNNANVEITEEAKANVEATKLIANLDDYFDDFSPTDYRACEVDNCVILEKDFEYIYSSVLGTVDLIVHNPPTELRIEFVDNQLVFGEEIYNLDYFSFANDFAISTSINERFKVTVTFQFTFVSETNSYSFMTAYTFDQAVIPES